MVQRIIKKFGYVYMSYRNFKTSKDWKCQSVFGDTGRLTKWMDVFPPITSKASVGRYELVITERGWNRHASNWPCQPLSETRGSRCERLLLLLPAHSATCIFLVNKTAFRPQLSIKTSIDLSPFNILFFGYFRILFGYIFISYIYIAYACISIGSFR